MSCLSCKHFGPVELMAASDYRVTRWAPCSISDFHPDKFINGILPMAHGEFNEAIKVYQCDLWEVTPNA